MPSHLVGRRWYSPYGIILYHPCGTHSWADFEAAQSHSYGRGSKCPGCVAALERRRQASAGARPDALA